jgi:general nucleoside transport system permease protein
VRAAVLSSGDGAAPGPRLALPGRVLVVLKATALFSISSVIFFRVLGKPPGAVLWALLDGSFGSGFAVSETLVRASPILLCALATALPARLGLISVGAEGQVVVGAIVGTAFVLFGPGLGVATMPLLLLGGALGGAGWGAVAGWLRARLRVNETISTLLLNYIAPPLVDYLVYGPWKDPMSLGWPATVTFPDAARLSGYFGTRVHLGLALGLALVALFHVLLSRSRWGIELDLLRESPELAARAGLRFAPAVLGVLALGGALAGMAGITEASALEGRVTQASSLPSWRGEICCVSFR